MASLRLSKRHRRNCWSPWQPPGSWFLLLRLLASSRQHCIQRSCGCPGLHRLGDVHSHDTSSSVGSMGRLLVPTLLGLPPPLCVLNYTTINASMATIAVISIERQLAVTSPAFHHSRVTKKILLKIEIVLLAAAMLIASVPSGFQWVKYDKWEGVCTIGWFTYQAALIYVISAFLGCFTIPPLLTLLANLKIIRVSYRTSKRKVRG